tara:strand:- start:8591 stop:12439 length:3849 start_codon:yes stop_codon:yes gene_type:complete
MTIYNNEISKKLRNDLNQNQISIVIKLVIGPESTAHEDYNKTIYLSSHAVKGRNALGATAFGNHQQYKPLILKISSINESVSHESRNFKISNVSVSVSNYKIDGHMFSDMLYNRPLINEKAKIYWSTPSNITENSASYLAFRGYVKRVSVQSDEVRLELEDESQLKFQKELPIHRTSISQNIPAKHRDKTIPILYGLVDRAPAVLDVGNVLKADSEPVKIISAQESTSNYYFTDGTSDGYVELWNLQTTSAYNTKWCINHKIFNEDYQSPIMMSVNGNLSFIPVKTLEALENFDLQTFSEKDKTQWETMGDGSVRFRTQVQPGITSSVRDILQIISPSKPSSIQCYKKYFNEPDYFNDGESGWLSYDQFNEKIVKHCTDSTYLGQTLTDLRGSKIGGDGTQANGDWWWWEGTPSGIKKVTLIRMIIQSAPDIDNIAQSYKTAFSINKHLFPPMSSLATDSTHACYIFPILAAYNNSGDWWSTDVTYPTSKKVDLDSNLTSTFDSHCDIPKFKELFHFPELSDYEYIGVYSGHNYAGSTIESEIQNIGMPWFLYNKLEINDAFDSELDYGVGSYQPFVQVIQDTLASGEIKISFGQQTIGNADTTNVEGFSMWFDAVLSEFDLMHLLDVKNSFENDFFMSAAGRYDENSNLIRNPINIIKNIAINDIGIDEENIDTDSYNAALLAYDNFKFDFSVNKNINSKSLLEDIAKSTLCFPYFSTSGLLTFANIESSYSAEYYNNLDKNFIIKSEDVINYNFTKTKNEMNYSGIEFEYNYNYFDNTYQNKLTPLPLSEEELAFNNYSDINDNLLKFKSKYIRDTDTAEKIHSMMSHHYKNQHLHATIIVPLKYLHLQVGNIIKFDKLIEGKLALGIDYTKISLPNNQDYYPLFFIESIQKTTRNIKITMIQLHNLEGIVGHENSDWWEFPEYWHDTEEWHDTDYSDLFGTEIPEWEPGTDQIQSFFIASNPPSIQGLPYESARTITYGGLGVSELGLSEPYFTYNENGVSGEALRLIEVDTLNLWVYSLHDVQIALPGSDIGLDKAFGKDIFQKVTLHQVTASGSIVLMFHNIEEWTDLLPTEIGNVVTSDTIDMELLEIYHMGVAPFSDTGQGGQWAEYKYTLKQVNDIGDSFDFAWHLKIITLPQNYAGETFLADYDDPIFGNQIFTIKNLTQYTLNYDSPYYFSEGSLIIPEEVSGGTGFDGPEPPSSFTWNDVGGSGAELPPVLSGITGDVNNDYLINVQDLVMMVNVIMSDETGTDAMDIVDDGIINIFDVISLVSLILESQD